jgi:hypothetical protein
MDYDFHSTFRLHQIICSIEWPKNKFSLPAFKGEWHEITCWECTGESSAQLSQKKEGDVSSLADPLDVIPDDYQACRTSHVCSKYKDDAIKKKNFSGSLYGFFTAFMVE